MDNKKKMKADRLYDEGNYLDALIEYSDLQADDETGEIAYRLGVCNEKGLGDKDEAKYWYEKARERGYSEKPAETIAPSPKPAPKPDPTPKPKKLTLEEKAEQGDAEAQFTLGVNYDFGKEGYPVNHEKAVK